MPQQLAWLTDRQAPPSPKGTDVVDATDYLTTVGVDRCSPLHLRRQQLVAPLGVEGYGRQRPAQLSLCGDDRAPLMLLLGVDEPDAIARSDWVRIALADKPEPPGRYPEVETTFADFEQHHCYDRCKRPVSTTLRS